MTRSADFPGDKLVVWRSHYFEFKFTALHYEVACTCTYALTPFFVILAVYFALWRIILVLNATHHMWPSHCTLYLISSIHTIDNFIWKRNVRCLLSRFLRLLFLTQFKLITEVKIYYVLKSCQHIRHFAIILTLKNDCTQAGKEFQEPAWAVHSFFKVKCE